MTKIDRPPLGDRLTSSKVIAVLRAPHVSVLAPVCDVLVDEGILSLELTLTTPGLLDALPDLVGRYATTADVGVGTILTESDAERAIECGAQFLVTPTMNLPVVRLAVATPGRGLSWRPDSDRTRSRLAGRRDCCQDLSRADGRRQGISSICEVRSPICRPSRPAESTSTLAVEWLAAGAAAVSIGGPLLGDALKGGDLGPALRDRCRAVRAVVGETVRS